MIDDTLLAERLAFGHDDRAERVREQMRQAWGDHPTIGWLDKQ